MRKGATDERTTATQNHRRCPEPPAQPDKNQITYALIHLTPEGCQAIIDVSSYQRQRAVKPVNSGMLSDAMINDEFIEGSLLTFAPEDFGEPVLVDGQHRLLAAVQAGWTGEWLVRCLWGPRYVARRSYIHLDTAQKERTPAVIGHAAGYDHLSQRLQTCIVAAARYQNQWCSDYELPPFCRMPPPRDNLARIAQIMPAFEAADAIISDSRTRTHLKRRLCTPMVMAIMAASLADMGEEARKFWLDAATNGEGIASDLRNRLIEGKPPKTGMYYMARLAAQAWNQRDSTRPLRRDNLNTIKLAHTNLVIPV